MVCNNIFGRICSRYGILLLSFLLLCVSSSETLGQNGGITRSEAMNSTIINPETIFPNTTIEYRKYGDFDYYNKAGQRVGGGRKQKDGSYKVFYNGRVKTQGYLFGTEPKKSVSKDSIVEKGVPELLEDRSVTDSSHSPTIIREQNNYPVGATVVRDRGGEVIRQNIDKTSYDYTGRPYYRWNSTEMSTSYIKDPRIRAEVRYAQNKTDERQRAADRKR